MRTRLFLLFALTATAFMANGPRLAAQQPSSPPTLWNFLGIPQGTHRVRDAMTNRKGNFPGLERKPALKSIADPANLESGVPAMEAAAKIKQAEDMKAQKIKAIKYLASIGCGCYDKDKTITNALLASLEDCTEEVRLATVQAIMTAAEGKACGNCHANCCCGKELVEKLSEIAYELDDSGCFLEPSERVRAAAIQALRVCCPSRQPLEIVEALPDDQEYSEEDIPDAGEQIPLDGEISAPPAEIFRPSARNLPRDSAPKAFSQDRQARVMPPSSRRPFQGKLTSSQAEAARQAKPAVVSRAPFQWVADESESNSERSERSEGNVERQRPVRPMENKQEEAPVSSRRGAVNRSVSYSTPSLPADHPTAEFGKSNPTVVSAVRGTVEGLDAQRGLAIIRVPAGETLAVGGKLKVFAQVGASSAETVAMEVVEARPGLVRARPIHAGQMEQVSRGDHVIAW